MTKILGGGLSRRTMLRGVAATGAVLAAPNLNRAWAAEPVEINMLAWYGHGEPDMVEEFEAVNNVKFKPKYYAGGDNMLALIAQSPPGTYDILLSDAEFVQQLNAAGYIEEMDPADYPFDDFFPEFQKFPGHWTGDKLWSVMCRYGHLGVSFNTEIISHKEAMTYNVLWDSRLTGKVGHFDWHVVGHRMIASLPTAPNHGDSNITAANTPGISRRRLSNSDQMVKSFARQQAQGEKHDQESQTLALHRPERARGTGGNHCAGHAQPQPGLGVVRPGGDQHAGLVRPWRARHG